MVLRLIDGTYESDVHVRAIVLISFWQCVIKFGTWILRPYYRLIYNVFDQNRGDTSWWNFFSMISLSFSNMWRRRAFCAYIHLCRHKWQIVCNNLNWLATWTKSFKSFACWICMNCDMKNQRTKDMLYILTISYEKRPHITNEVDFCSTLPVTACLFAIKQGACLVTFAVVLSRFAESEVKYPTFPKFLTFQNFRLLNIKGMKFGC